MSAEPETDEVEMTERERWLEYERRKAALDYTGLSPFEYHQAVNRIAEELGL